jgi:hypothetical protein
MSWPAISNGCLRRTRARRPEPNIPRQAHACHSPRHQRACRTRHSPACGQKPIPERHRLACGVSAEPIVEFHAADLVEAAVEAGDGHCLRHSPDLSHSLSCSGYGGQHRRRRKEVRNQDTACRRRPVLHQFGDDGVSRREHHAGPFRPAPCGVLLQFIGGSRGVSRTACTS